jgi:hypothetical protein
LLSAARCAFVPPPPVDPQAIQLSAEFGPTPTPTPSGTLRVVTETHDYAYGEHGVYSLHDGYDIYDERGRWIEHVPNHVSPTDEDVTDVRLAAGKYVVAIPEGRHPRTWIGVQVVDGKLTKADLTRLQPNSGQRH